MLNLALLWQFTAPWKSLTLRNVVDYHRALWTLLRKIGMDRSSKSCNENESLRGATFFFCEAFFYKFT